MFEIKITGLNEVKSFINNLPKEIDKNVAKEGIMELAKNLQKRMKYRAPVGPTGWLKRSIMVEKGEKRVSVVVNAFYAMAVEEGRGPNASGNYLIPIEYFEQHNSLPETPGQYVSNPKAFVDLRNSLAAKPRPFIIPAINSWIPKIDSILIKSVKKALNKANQR